MFQKKYLTYIVNIFVLCFLFGYSVLAWQPAPASPPSNNVDVPLNVGSSPHIKSSGLQLESLIVRGGTNLATVSGDVGIGGVPTQKLDVLGTTRLRGHLFGVDNSSGSTGQVLSRTDSGPVWAAIGSASHNHDDLYLKRGVGTWITSSDNQPRLLFYDDSHTYLRSPSNIYFRAGGDTTRMTILSTGQVTFTGDISAPANVWGTCDMQAATCNAAQECPNGRFVTRIERLTGSALCGTAPNHWYQMRITCCQI
jgi:hypothetical protein